MKKCLIVSAMLALSLALTACGGSAEETVLETETTAVVEEKLKVYGDDVEGAWKVQLTNSTGEDIKGIAVKKTSDTEFSSNILTKDAIFADKEEIVICYQAKEDETETVSDKILNDTYDVRITLKDDTAYVLTAFPFEDMDACEIKVEDEAAFIVYESLSTKEKISTKEAQLAVKALETEKVYEEDYSYEDEYTYDDSSYTNTNPSTNDISTSVDQGSDSCLGNAEVNTPSLDQSSDSCLGGAEANTSSGGSDISDEAMNW